MTLITRFSRRVARAIGAVALLGTAACSGVNPSAPVEPDTLAEVGEGTPSRNTPGRYDRTLVSGQSSRTYTVYIPERARGQASPVVLMLHGASGDGPLFYAESGWREKADATGLIAVFPTALEYCWRRDENGNGSVNDREDRHLETIWSSGELGTSSTPLCSAAEVAALPPAVRARVDHPLEDDVAFIRRLLDELTSTYLVDTRRVYVSGFSSGGSMASRLAQDASERFAAVAVNSASLNVVPSPSSRSISVFRVMGDRERAYPAAFGLAILPLTRSLLTDFPLIQTKMHAPYLTTLALTDQYLYDELMLAGRKTSRFTYRASTVGGSNVFLSHVVEGLEHEYPNGKNHPVVMADVLWEFFAAHAR